MTSLVVASNRGPYSVTEGPDGEPRVSRGGGGLAPSLASALGERGEEATWVAAAMTDAERRLGAAGATKTDQEGLYLRLVEMREVTYKAAYDVVSNQTLWFAYHGLFETARRPVFSALFREAWEEFRSYNKAFAEAIAEEADEEALCLVNDYHLPLVGKWLAAERPDLQTVHFTHTPFPSPGELNVLPRDARRELLEGMGGFGACGFHTERWRAGFLSCMEAAGERAPETFSCGLGADSSRLLAVAASPECLAARRQLDELRGGRAMVFRSDRVELSKNIARGFLAFDELLSDRKDLRGNVVFVARAYSSREGLPEYLAYRSEVEHLVEILNERWEKECGGAPIALYVEDDFQATVAGLSSYDVLLVNPVRDGMNLVAKEGSALNEKDGLLVLSEEAGAFEELSGAALGVHPFDLSDQAAGLARALDMPAAERHRRAAELRRLSVSRPPAEWLSFLLEKARRPA